MSKNLSLSSARAFPLATSFHERLSGLRPSFMKNRVSVALEERGAVSKSDNLSSHVVADTLLGRINVLPSAEFQFPKMHPVFKVTYDCCFPSDFAHWTSIQRSLMVNKVEVTGRLSPLHFYSSCLSQDTLSRSALVFAADCKISPLFTNWAERYPHRFALLQLDVPIERAGPLATNRISRESSQHIHAFAIVPLLSARCLQLVGISLEETNENPHALSVVAVMFDSYMCTNPLTSPSLLLSRIRDDVVTPWLHRKGSTHASLAEVSRELQWHQFTHILGCVSGCVDQTIFKIVM